MWTRTVRLVTVLTGLAALLLMPDPHRLPEQATGDPELVAMVRDAVDDPEGYRGLSVALVEDGRVRFAGLGDRGDGAPAGPDTPFEIGSVTKVLTGMLLADLVADGTVAPSDTLDTALPGITGDSAEITLEELASHRSGLPRIPLTSPGFLVRMLWANLSAGNPYGGQDRDEVVGVTSRLGPGGGRGTVSYSNLGVAVLGHALAAHTETTYAELLQRRLLGPLGMAATTVVHSPDELPSDRARGAHASGRAASPWIGAGYAPAGVGVWSTAADLSRLLQGVLSTRAPGADAATPRFDAGADRVGYGWFTTRYADREITWHNGGTGGFSTFVGFDPTAGRGVVVLGNTDKDVDPIGLRLLGVSAEEAGGANVGTPGWIRAALGLAFPLLGGWSLRSAARQGPDRLAVVSAGVWAVVMLLLAHRLGNWLLIPPPLWAAGVAFTAAAMALAVPRIKELPTSAPGRTRRRWTESACSLAFALAGVGAALV